MELTIKGMTSLSERIFIVILFLIAAPQIVFTTQLPFNSLLVVILMGIGIILSLVKLLLIDNIRFSHKLIAIFVLLFEASFHIGISHNIEFFLLVILVISAFDVRESIILKSYLAISVTLFLTMTILALTGVIPDVVFVLREGIPKHSFGSIFPTDYVARFLYICLIGFYLFSDKIKNIGIGLVILLTGLLFIFTGAKINVVSILLLIVLFYFGNGRYPKIIKAFKFASNKIIVLIMPFFAVAISLMSFLYSDSSVFWNSVNLFMNDRLLYGNRGFHGFGITLLGQNINWVGVQSALAGAEYNFVDASYLNCLFAFGIWGILSLLVAYAFLCARKKGNIRFLIVIFVISLNAVFEHHLVDVAYNPFLLLLFSNLDVEDKFCVMSKK